MENFSTLIENSKRAVRYWWLLLIIGIALFVVGILVFVYPTQSYLGMSLLFGWLMLISGILEVVLSSVNKHFITGRGWMLAGGIIEIVLGIILIFNVALSAATLPIFLGFWLMLRAFGAIGLGSDMGAMQIAGSGWTIFSGILLLLCIVIYSFCMRMIRLCYQPNQDELHPSKVDRTLSWSALTLLLAAIVVGVWQPGALERLIAEIASL